MITFLHMVLIRFSVLGCQNFTSMDGIWKLRFPHCMWPVKSEVCGVPHVNFPNVCTEEPSNPDSAFCEKHFTVAQERGVPTRLREFVHDFCGMPLRHVEGESFATLLLIPTLA